MSSPNLRARENKFPFFQGGGHVDLTAVRFLTESVSSIGVPSKSCADTRRAVEAYARAKGSDEATSLALEIKLRVERRAGEFLRDMDLKAGRASGNNTTLVSLGITNNESSRRQRLAAPKGWEGKVATLPTQRMG